MFHILREMGLKMHDLSIRNMRGFQLKEEPRQLILKPRQFRKEGPVPDELNKGCFKMKLSFELPRGSYATLVVRRLLARPVKTQRDETMGKPDERGRGIRPGEGRSAAYRPAEESANESYARPRPGGDRSGWRSEIKEPLPTSIRRKTAAAESRPTQTDAQTEPEERKKVGFRPRRRLSVLRRLHKDRGE